MGKFKENYYLKKKKKKENPWEVEKSMKLLREAEIKFKEAVRIDSRNFRSWNYLGNCLYEIAKLKRVKKKF
jgi:hypothetical protein